MLQSALAKGAAGDQNSPMHPMALIYASGTFLMILGTWRRWHERRWGLEAVWVAAAILTFAQFADFIRGCETQDKFDQQVVCNFIPVEATTR
jgi:hypothetical protein